jgi:hypothetical protein
LLRYSGACGRLFYFESLPYLAPMRFSLFAFLFFSSTISAQKVFDFNAQCQLAYKEIIQLKLNSGQKMINEEKARHPDNLIPYFLENYIDFFVLFFNEDPAEYKIRKDNLSRRIQLMDQGPEYSPFSLFTKSIIYFQWAAVKIKFGSTWDAGWGFRRAFLLSRENQQKFPSFTPNKMLFGAMQVAAGTIPDGYKWLSGLLGIKGTIKGGMQQLESFLTAEDVYAMLYRTESTFYYLYLKFYIENKKDEVFAFITQKNIDIKNNHLFAYLASNLGVNNQQSDYAMKVLTQMNNDTAYMRMPLWDMEMGYAKLNHLDKDADSYLKKFVQEFKGKFYKKEVLQRLSWYYYLSGEQQKADEARNLIVQNGGLETEADKQAQKEAVSGKWQNKILLKARLLNDGGYHEEALAVLTGKSSSDFNLPEDKLEFAYRLGRIYDDLGKKDRAVAAYLTAIKLGEKRHEYFASRAALQIGFIYEQRNERAKALAFFQKCLDMKNHDYKNSLDQKAKAGIARCSIE